MSLALLLCAPELLNSPLSSGYVPEVMFALVFFLVFLPSRCLSDLMCMSVLQGKTNSYVHVYLGADDLFRVDSLSVANGELLYEATEPGFDALVKGSFQNMGTWAPVPSPFECPPSAPTDCATGVTLSGSGLGMANQRYHVCAFAECFMGGMSVQYKGCCCWCLLF